MRFYGIYSLQQYSETPDLVWGETQSVAPERMRVWHPRTTCGLAGQCITLQKHAGGFKEGTSKTEPTLFLRKV